MNKGVLAMLCAAAVAAALAGCGGAPEKKEAVNAYTGGMAVSDNAAAAEIDSAVSNPVSSAVSEAVMPEEVSEEGEDQNDPSEAAFDGGWWPDEDYGWTPEWTPTASGVLNSFDGVNSYGGRTETYYSSNVLYHYRTQEWTLGSDGVYRDSDGYVVVAASDIAMGETVDTSLGMGKVYDTGCAAGVTDVYVAW